ncbi:MAG: magnesium and cobalt transport protein CorA [Nitrospirales bacterium]|nr:MAG: magnesium and cobalt transport protein CorA [Nitrospirales bacterium]
MAKSSKMRSTKSGLPPGTPVHLGKQHSTHTEITWYRYNHDSLHRDTFIDQWPTGRNRDSDDLTWIHVQGVHDCGILTALGNDFDLHPLVIEDIANTHQRPKLEDYGDYLFLVVRQVVIRDGSEELFTEQFSVVVGPRFVMSFQEGRDNQLEPFQKRLDNSQSPMRSKGSDYLAYELLDFVIDQYFEILEHFDRIIDEIDDELEMSPSPLVLRKLHDLKRELILFRKSIWPLREVLNHLERSPTALILEPTRPFFRDIHDHTVTMFESLEIFRDLTGSMLELYHTTMSTKMNETMKLLTVTATVFLPLTLITGVFGMNFQHIPGIEWYWAFPMLLLTMGVMAGGMYLFFKKKGWI